MDYIDYDTEQSLFAAAESSSGNEQMAMVMSMPSQRRLIRKPLPELPENQGIMTGGQSQILARTSSSRQNAMSLEKSRQRASKVSLEEQKQLNWWPPIADKKHHSEINEESKPGPYRLGDYYKSHLLRIIKSSLRALGTPSNALAESVFDALVECLSTISTLEAMRALRQSHSYLWRIEAIIRSKEEQDHSQASKGGGRWPRLPGWQGGRNSLPTNTEARRKKRDIAFQLLGSALRISGGGVTSHLGEMDDMSDDAASDIVPEKVVVKRTPGSAPQLLLKTSVPTVALQTGSGSEELKLKAVEVDKAERVSVLTSRLAMQLKNSAKNASDAPEKSTHKGEEAIMAVCRVCLEFKETGDDDDADNLDRRRRSGTVTLQTTRREQNTSKMSTLSNQTIREHTMHRNIKIAWKADTFIGSALLLNPLSSETEGWYSKADSQLQLVGGTFLVESSEEDIQLESIIRDVLNTGLYAACAMMMESSLLRDLHLEDVVEEKQAEEVEVHKDDQADTVLPETQTPPIVIEALPERQSRWTSGIWGLLHYPLVEQRSNPVKVDPPDSPGSKGPQKRGKKSSAYNVRIGKILGSFASGTGKQSLPGKAEPDHARVELADENEPELESEPPRIVEQEKLEHEGVPLSISPYYSAQTTEDEVHWEGDGYQAQLLSQQAMSLTVSEGMDLSLFIGSRQQQGASIQRAPLVARHSFPDAETGFVASPSHSVRSASLHVGPSSASKPSELPPSTASVETSQRDVQFYQKTGLSRDISLGQAIEEMTSKAGVLDEQARLPVKKPKEHAESTNFKAGSSRTYRVAEYLHGHDRISIMANVARPSDTSCTPNDKSNSESTSESPEGDDPSSIIEQLVSASTAGQNGREVIMLWTANVRTGEETAAQTMSEATYLSSYGIFLQALLSHPKLANEKHDVVRMVQIGTIMLKFQVQPIVVFDLLVEGPVVHTKRSSDDDKRADGDKKDEKLLERTRMEIQSFYSSVKRHVSTLEHIVVARELDEKGKTMKPPALKTRPSISSLQSGNTSKDISPQNGDIEDNLFPSAGALELLSKLKKAFRDVEFELYEGLKMVRASTINDVRMRFESYARSTKKRLAAWEEKHLNKDEVKRLEPLDYLEPEYFEARNHVFPGSRYLFREDEPLSMIAYTLSSREFNTELHSREEKHANVLDWRTSVLAPSTQSQLSTSATSTHTTSTATSTLDPDEDLNFDTDEPLQVKMKRKKRVKDAGILSLTLKRANSNLSTQSSQESSTPASTAHDQSDTNTPTVSKLTSSHFDTISSSNDTFRAHVAHLDSKISLGNLFEGNSTAASTPNEEKGPILISEGSTSSHSTARGASNSTTLQVPTPDAHQRRTVSQPVEDIHSTAQVPPISPHIKHSIVSGNLKISCVSWFAEDFAKLRKVWEIEDEFIHSMTRCKSRSTMGGKSKSGFFVTLDGKWIAKQLLTIWTVDEREAFLEFAPAYLRYMMNSAVNDCPTLLVKIAGVFTLKFKNLKTGEVNRMSVQVLENVFAGDGGESTRFDIKGIRDRRVQVKKDSAGQQEEAERAPVWWDGEWLDCFQARAFVPQAHKLVFQRALSNDMAFLTASNVMDYSLLIGAQENQTEEHSKPTFRVRIVDFLGAFTLAKAIESSGKRAMKSQTPTIIPPSDYAARFSSNVQTYFTGCPT